MLKAVLFDMDGVMVDTELLQSQAFESVMAEYGVINPEKNEHGTIHVSGATTPETWEILKKRYGFEADTDELTAKKRAAVMTVIEGGVDALPGLYVLLEDLKSHGIKIAVGSSAQRERIGTVLDKLGISEYFSAIISAADVKRGKPHPEVYLKAAEAVGVNPSDCVVVEDAYTGAQAAKAAGAKLVAVPHQYTRNMDFSTADLIVGSLSELDHAKLSELFFRE
jgi:beta-phosphoglucomutase